MAVQPLAERDQSSMLGSLLKNSNRSLTPAQKQRVLTAYEDNKPTALYLKLATDIALKWKSYTDIADCHLAPTTVGLITQLFKELEGEHGEVFVSRALGYITAARNGLSANELLDILSCDDVVLDDVFQYQSPPVRRLPPLLWLRLKSDLGNYLVEGSTDDTIVYRWYHYLFIEVAKQRYLRELGTQLHQSLANYFMGRWAHSPKPYRSKQTGKTMSALRGVPEQPLILDMNKETNMTINKDGSAIHNKRYNLRTLTELPHHLIEGNMWAEAEEIMCNIPWLEAKCMIGRTYETCLELAQASMKCDTSGNKLDHFYKFMRANSHVLQQQPDLICQQALNQPDTSACCQIAKEYLREHHYRMQCWIDMSKKQTASPLVLTLHHPSAVTLCVLSRQCQYLAAACSDKTLRVWQVANGEHLMTVECDAVAAIFPSHHNWLVVAEHNNLKIFGMGQGGTSKGKLMKVIHVDVDHIPAMFIPKNNKEIHMVSFGKFYKFSSLSGKMLQKKELKVRF
ncbi:NACHT domain- and WD repeat-containing protein 1-like [Saccoglossus kowalevskii]